MDFPIVVKSASCEPIRKNWSLSDKIGAFVKIRPCDKEYAGKTFLGIFIGEFPLGVSANFNPESGELKVSAACYNPAIFVPDIGKVVFGMESWWGAIKSPDDLKDITNSDINNIWYVKAMKQLEDSGKLESEAKPCKNAMKASMDVVRKNVARAYNDLAKLINEDEKTLSGINDQIQRAAILEQLGYLRQSIAFLLCIYEDRAPDHDINDLSEIADKLAWPKGQGPDDDEEESEAGE